MHQDTTIPHAIITGGSSGIGKAIALRLARQGANVSLIARGQERLQLAKTEIEQVRSHPDQQVLTLVADVGEREQAMGAVGDAIASLGPPHWLITSAGIAIPGYFQELPPEIFEETMRVNYFGTLYCIQAALPAMEQQQVGNIHLISSGAALVGIYGYSAYGPSKFAVRGLAETLRAELKPVGIKVSISYPPDTDTPQLEEENKTKPPATKEINATAKLWTADDVAKVILEGIEQGKFELSPGTEISVLTRLHSVIAPLLNRYFDSIIARNPRPS